MDTHGMGNGSLSRSRWCRRQSTRKRARDKGRGSLISNKEKAGVRAPRRKRRNPEPVYTQLEEEPEAEETSRDGRSKRKGDMES